MRQPVIDTLQVADALQRTGMEREQAQGLARTLGAELGHHVAVRQDLDAASEATRNELRDEIRAVSAEMDTRFQKVDTQFVQLRAEMAAMGAELGGRIQGLEGRIDALAGQFKFLFAGLGLVVALLAVVIGVIGVLHANPPAPPAPPPITLHLPAWPSTTIPGGVQVDVSAPRPAPGTTATP